MHSNVCGRVVRRCGAELQLLVVAGVLAVGMPKQSAAQVTHQWIKDVSNSLELSVAGTAIVSPIVQDEIVLDQGAFVPAFRLAYIHKWGDQAAWAINAGYWHATYDASGPNYAPLSQTAISTEFMLYLAPRPTSRVVYLLGFGFGQKSESGGNPDDFSGDSYAFGNFNLGARMFLTKRLSVVGEARFIPGASTCPMISSTATVDTFDCGQAKGAAWTKLLSLGLSWNIKR